MGGDIFGILQENLLRPEAWDGALPMSPIHDGMEVGSVSFPFRIQFWHFNSRQKVSSPL